MCPFIKAQLLASIWGLNALSPCRMAATKTHSIVSRLTKKTALRKAQQAMSRKVRFSRNWKKAKARIQRIQTHIGSARRDYLHKISTAISKTTRWSVLKICRCEICPSQRRAQLTRLGATCEPSRA